MQWTVALTRDALLAVRDLKDMIVGTINRWMLVLLWFFEPARVDSRYRPGSLSPANFVSRYIPGSLSPANFVSRYRPGSLAPANFR